MRKQRVKTPEQIAKSSSLKKKPYALYLDSSLMEYLKKRAASAEVSVSAIVNEAIRLYVEDIKSSKD